MARGIEVIETRPVGRQPAGRQPRELVLISTTWDRKQGALYAVAVREGSRLHYREWHANRGRWITAYPFDALHCRSSLAWLSEDDAKAAFEAGVDSNTWDHEAATEVS